MSDHDAYADEMFRTGIKDRDVEGVLSGQAAEGPGGEGIADFLSDLRRAYTRAPAEEVQTAHLAMIAQAVGSAREAGTSADRHRPRRVIRMTRRRRPLYGVALVLALSLTTVSLAMAGVTLPRFVRTPFHGIGIDLPNQPASGDVHAVIDSTPTGERGCEFGQRVAQAASGGAGGPSEDPCARAGGPATSPSPAQENTGSGDQSGTGRSFGRRTSHRARNGAAEDGRAFGQSTAEGAQGLTPAEPQAGSDNAPSAGASGQAPPEAGGGAPADHSQSGQVPQEAGGSAAADHSQPSGQTPPEGGGGPPAGHSRGN